MSKKDKLIALRKKALEADLPLKKGATNLVFGAGNPDAEVLFIGEGPGFWEDKKGIPFVGRAGALLNEMLQSIGLERKNVFITNMVMYRPPENRDPEPQELEAYKPYIDGIIDIIEPRVIVTLGRFSMDKFIPGVYISKVHGIPYTITWKGREITVLPMYHPAAALRSGNIKEKALGDFEKLDSILKKRENTTQEETKEDDETKQMKLL